MQCSKPISTRSATGNSSSRTLVSWRQSTSGCHSAVKRATCSSRWRMELMFQLTTRNDNRYLLVPDARQGDWARLLAEAGQKDGGIPHGRATACWKGRRPFSSGATCWSALYPRRAALSSGRLVIRPPCHPREGNLRTLSGRRELALSIRYEPDPRGSGAVPV